LKTIASFRCFHLNANKQVIILRTKLNKRYNQKEKFCVNCVYCKSTSSGKVFCHKTSRVPNFKFFCPDFKIHTASDFRSTKLLKKERIDLKKLSKEAETQMPGGLVLAFYSMMLILVIIGFTAPKLSPETINILIGIFGGIAFFTAISVPVIIANKAAFYRLLMPNPFLGKYAHLPYYYLILSLHLYSKKEKRSTDDLRIIEQAIIRVFGQRYLKYAKHFISYGTKGEINGKYFRKYVLKIEYKFRILLFMLSAELCVHNNAVEFRKSEVLKNIAFILDIQPEDYTQIKKELELQEFEYHKKIEEQKRLEEAERKRQQKQRQNSYRIFSIAQKDYYAVLGLKSSASIPEIKSKFRELAVKFHPDKHVNNLEKQKEASEKFKEYSEAYNYLKDKKGF
jgi:DnaJ-domain-containing protein 1